MVSAKKADFDAIASKFHISPVTARLLRNRNMVTEEEIDRFLNGTMEDLHDPFLMKGMREGCELLLQGIERKAKLRIIGDYDVDGICATYILLRGLRALGADADTVIPHRIKDGYGLNDHLIEQAREDHRELLLTCDNGIAAASQITLAKSYGMQVIVTDHHEVPFEDGESGRCELLPPADAVIDPKQAECGYPYKQICGAVVAYKLLTALFTLAGKADEIQIRELLRELTSFAALATVCDVMELLDENRIIVRYGLMEMERTENIGLKALLEVNGLTKKVLSPYHAGFVIGPCINATGRLDTAQRALALFDSASQKDAVVTAADLKALNESRKSLTEEGVKQAVAQVEACYQKDDVLVIYLPECHESLAGIIAGRVRERYHKPVFVLTDGEEGVKGSGRSIEAYSMYEELSKCKELFAKFGGHRLAAGLTLAGGQADEGSGEGGAEDASSEGTMLRKQRTALVERFRRTLNEHSTLTEEDFQEVVHIDVPMPLSYADEAFLTELQKLEPFGVGNPRPLFARKGISLLSGSRIGKEKQFRKFRIADEQGNSYPAVYFGDGTAFDTYLEERYGKEKLERLYGGRLALQELVIQMVYYPDRNEYQGRTGIQYVIQYYE